MKLIKKRGFIEWHHTLNQFLQETSIVNMSIPACCIYAKKGKKNLFNFIDVCILPDKTNEGDTSVYFIKA